MNMKEAKERLMQIAGDKYHSIRYELTDDGSGGVSQKCAVYVSKYSWFEGGHWDEVLTALENAMSGKSPISEDLPVSAKAQ